MKPIGRTTWAIAGGHIPLRSQGPEPKATSRDELSVLNTGETDAHLEITIYYADGEPDGPYHFTVSARRIRRVRFNDLIDPQAIPLDTDYGAVIESDVPIVVEFSRFDSSQGTDSLVCLVPFSNLNK